MGWFDEQIKYRKAHDHELFTDSIKSVGDSVNGTRKKVSQIELSTDAIRTILKYYGYSKNIEIPGDMTEFYDRLTYMCRPTGMQNRQIRLTENWWKDCIGAVLAIRKDDGSAVAMIPDGFGYHFLNGDVKERVSRRNCDLFEETGYCFYKPFPNRKLYVFDLVKYAFFTRSIKDMVFILAFMGISTLIGLLSPKLSHFLYNNVIESGSVPMLFSTVLFMLCASISQMLFGQFQNMYNSIISTKMDIALSSATMMRILSLPASFFRKYSSGEISERSKYLKNLTQMLMGIIFGTGLTSLFSMAYFTSIFNYAPGLVIPALIIMFATISFSLIVTFSRQKLNKEGMELSAKESGMNYAMISGIQKIRVAGAEKRAFARWANLYAQNVQRSYSPPMFVRVSGVISMTISLSGTLVMYYFAIKTGVDMAQYTAFNAAYGMLYGAFSSIASLATTGTSIKPIYDMAKPIMDCVPEEIDGKEIITDVTGRIDFSNVSFSYGENTPLIIDNLSLSIKSNQYIAIVGKTGCGKSTLIRLLLGFEKPQKGAIYFDGKDLTTLNLQSLRRKIGVVMQNSDLFQGDIYSNITISAPWLTMDEAWDAAELAGIADDIAEMPMGMHTLISEGSGGISGGQKQRLMIARAIAPKPKILIFDEATSALDNITQKKVSEALDSLHCTRIVIAHRLSTIKHCDRILFLEGGKIVEDGTYDELVALNGRFAELIERQRIDT